MAGNTDSRSGTAELLLRDPTRGHVPAEGAAMLSETASRLGSEFSADPDRLELIRAVVAHCHRDLQGAPTGAMPELVERSARQRLLASADET
ncbi:hypothetical protein [Pseudonocardia sp. T1-2H]|uniref:hypothetical protein n=1 Tax=Pseudonocardia sp. T1-2H TaxID=3128899 RepID=UPI0031018171